MVSTLWKRVVRTGRILTQKPFWHLKTRGYRGLIYLRFQFCHSHTSIHRLEQNSYKEKHNDIITHTHTHQKIIFKLSFTYMIVMCNCNMSHWAWWITVMHFITFWGWNSASTIYHLVLSHVQWFLTHSVNRYSVTAEQTIHLCYKYNLQYCNVKILNLC